jgi:bifunctional non-homologous end joining protein LigD
MKDGVSLFAAVREMGLEGIMAKQRNSPYLPAKRNDFWLKIKARQTTECVIVGYTKGEGERRTKFGALHLAQFAEDALKYRGKVGTGFDDKMMGAIFEQLSQLTIKNRPVKEKPLDAAQSVWVEPKIMCEIEYASITPDGMLREPVFKRLRPDLTLEKA